ncbi:MAG: alpha/beta hydrolase fold domain-containing protein [Acidimicrobiales bacterium]|nr:alpha/beta hydrolase fold domain-containing protein [Acidimicrobiales bacterium]RZV47241.1 MAG: steryl acetyl hydrolase [Acidimicrobiales bacterium]
MSAAPSHLSEGAAAYLSDPDQLEYPDDWTDPWCVQEFRDLTNTLWAGANESIDFDYDVVADAIDGVPVERITIPSRTPGTDAVIMHLHGGMFCLGTPEIDRVLNAPLARSTGLEVISVDYRLAPEHPCPAAIEDAIAVYERISQEQRVILVGESAGGGLAAACAVAARDKALRPPEALVMLSPMLDLTGGSDTYATLPGADPDYGDTSALLGPAAAYAGQIELDDPRVSPLAGDLDGLPPTLIQVGNREVLLGDSTRFARKARSAGVDVQLEVQDAGWHNYPIWYGVPEADAAVASISTFITEALA